MIAWISEIKNAFLALVLKLLPFSPFSKYIDALEEVPYLGYLNWFVPVKEFVAIGSTWLGAITTYYLLSILLRWLKAID